MAKRRTIPQLSAGEMEIMDVLWEHGAVTLAEAHQALAARRPLGYTTVQTRLNRLVGKGVVSRTRLRPAQYEAIVPPSAVGARHIDVLLEKIRGFRVVPLVAHLIRERKLSPEEVAELRRLITEVEEASRRT
jgi:BlaI family transcriptional regulator, penicillinase repressor